MLFFLPKFQLPLEEAMPKSSKLQQTSFFSTKNV